MKEYYIVENGEKKGAFSLKDLKYETVLPDTLIWKEGWEEWQEAKDAANIIPEIDLIIDDTPPIEEEGRVSPTKKKNLLTTLARASEGDLSSMGSLVGIGEDEKGEAEQERTETQKEKLSFQKKHDDYNYNKNTFSY